MALKTLLGQILAFMTLKEYLKWYLGQISLKIYFVLALPPALVLVPEPT